MRVSRAFLVLACVMAGAFSVLTSSMSNAQATLVCEPAPAVKSALDQLVPYPSPDQSARQYRKERLAKLQELLRQYPDDIFVHRDYIQALTGSPSWDKLIQEYRSRSEQNPSSARWACLYALALIGRDTPEAVRVLDRALEIDPMFAWPHLSLARIYTAQNFKDQEKAKANLRTFLDGCPSTFEGYELLVSLDDKELIGQAAEKLRSILAARSDPDALGAYPTLWTLEFKEHPPSEFDSLRKQVAGDLERIRKLNMEDKREWYAALQEGYKLVNDQKQSDWAKTELERRFPNQWQLAAMDTWRKDHPAPKPDDPAAKKQAYYRELLQDSAQWVKERPNTTYIWMNRLDAMGQLDDIPVSGLVATANQALQVNEANAGDWGPESYVYFTVAELFTRKKIQAQRVIGLAQKGLAQLEVEEKRPVWDLYSQKKWTDEENFYRASQRIQALECEADAYIRLNQPVKTQEEFAHLNRSLQDLKSTAGDKESWRKEVARRQSAYWGLQGQLAMSQGRKQDAMAYFENALLTRLVAGVKPEPGRKDELAAAAHKLWTDIGGSEDGWQTWYGRPAAELASRTQLTWEKVSEPLPGFQLTDLKGKKWQLADLKGKELFLNFWASW